MSAYEIGHVKRNPEDGSIAIRTYFDESNPQLAPMAWRIATTSRGSRPAPTTEVDTWDDLYTPVPE